MLYTQTVSYVLISEILWYPYCVLYVFNCRETLVWYPTVVCVSDPRHILVPKLLYVSDCKDTVILSVSNCRETVVPELYCMPNFREAVVPKLCCMCLIVERQCYPVMSVSGLYFTLVSLSKLRNVG
jgi:hypothetical protein